MNYMLRLFLRSVLQGRIASHILCCHLLSLLIRHQDCGAEQDVKCLTFLLRRKCCLRNVDLLSGLGYKHSSDVFFEAALPPCAAALGHEGGAVGSPWEHRVSLHFWHHHCDGKCLLRRYHLSFRALQVECELLNVLSASVWAPQAFFPCVQAHILDHRLSSTIAYPGVLESLIAQGLAGKHCSASLLF